MPNKRKSTALKNKRRIRRAKPTARNQKRQIASNQNQILAIKRHMNLTKERMRWHCGFVNIQMDEYPFIIPLTSGPSTTTPARLNNGTSPATSVQWNEVMTARNGSGGNTGNNRSSFVVNKQYVDLTLSSGNESELVSYTAFLVQLVDKTARQTYVDTAGLSSMTRDADYCVPSGPLGVDSGYGAYINTDKYKIIKRLEFETAGILGSPHGSSIDANGDTGRGTRAFQVRRTQFKVNYGSTILKSAGGPNEDGGSLVYDEINPEQKRFIVIFHNNSSLDGQYPTVSMSSLVTGYAAE